MTPDPMHSRQDARGVTIFYILDDDGEPCPATCAEWAQWIETHHAARLIPHTELPDGGVLETFFVGSGSIYDDEVRDPNTYPLMWDTGVFGGPHDGEGTRSRTRVEALAAHRGLLAKLKGGG